MSAPVRIDAPWLRDNPLPPIGGGGDKESRGRGLLVGGSVVVPGALRLTCEAMLRVGAGKVQVATVESAALPLGVALPEAAVVALPQDEEGEIALDAAERLRGRMKGCQALVLGPAMSARPHTPELVKALLDALPDDAPALLDAAALTSCDEAMAAACRGGVVMTPHPGELARLTGIDKERIEADPPRAACDAARRFNAVVALKSSSTFIAAPDGTLLHYVSEAPGLGTAGSGDVLAGVIGGLLARGAAPLVAAAWGVWLHGEAGKAAGARVGPLGFLARELPRELPALMAAQCLR